MPLPTLTVRGNLVATPELRFTSGGTAVASARIAASERRRNRDTGEWEEGDECFLNCTLWGQDAENAAEHLNKGDPVLAHGKLRQRSYQNRNGESRTVYEVNAFDIAAVPRNRPSARTSDTTGESDPWAMAGAATAAPSTDEPPF